MEEGGWEAKGAPKLTRGPLGPSTSSAKLADMSSVPTP